ncbi:MAG: hypothetical protein JRF37_10365 [Deltaproteobacteria bacterium]|nr:hypothetical protein [Deltaproteobacteria bacterium]
MNNTNHKKKNNLSKLLMAVVALSVLILPSSALSQKTKKVEGFDGVIASLTMSGSPKSAVLVA